MALYPDTSCFYRAEVIASPQDVQPSGRVRQSHPILICVELKYWLISDITAEVSAYLQAQI